jgi:hypothetical protein
VGTWCSSLFRYIIERSQSFIFLELAAEGIPAGSDPVIRGILADICDRVFDVITPVWVDLVPEILGALEPFVQQLPPDSSIQEHFGLPSTPRVEPYPSLLAEVFDTRALLKEVMAIATADKDAFAQFADWVNDANGEIEGLTDLEFFDRATLVRLAALHSRLRLVPEHQAALLRWTLQSDETWFTVSDALASLLRGDVIGQRVWLFDRGQQEIRDISSGIPVL